MDNFLKVPFANGGDKTAIPETVQLNGAVSMQEGFGFDYQRDLLSDPDAKPIPRDQFNYLMNVVTAAVQRLQTFGGAAEFITEADNGGVAYSYEKGARVLSGGFVYESLIYGNEDVPPSGNWMLVDIYGQVPTGTVLQTFSVTADPGFLLLQGQEVSRTTYSNLFAKIGTVGGPGNGTTTFNLPDMRGVVARGLDASRGLDPSRTLGSYQDDTLQNVTGTFPGTNAAAGTGPFVTGSQIGNDWGSQFEGAPALISFDLSRTARTSTETRMKNIAANFQIKV
jgi:hypothetical protein